ncbi:putative glycerol-3-phosphate regulon repressor [Salmonella sp. NCTC 11881]|nr:putative glycerol-3-phosphate regulon repressor [Salmonella sp. NCTC 11881]
MKQTQRHDAIIELVKKQGYVSTEELVEHFSVSPQTIRRDLNDLAEQNMIFAPPRRRGVALQLGEHAVARS